MYKPKYTTVPTQVWKRRTGHLHGNTQLSLRSVYPRSNQINLIIKTQKQIQLLWNPVTLVEKEMGKAKHSRSEESITGMLVVVDNRNWVGMNQPFLVFRYFNFGSTARFHNAMLLYGQLLWPFSRTPISISRTDHLCRPAYIYCIRTPSLYLICYSIAY